jgi:hypothetical protein
MAEVQLRTLRVSAELDPSAYKAGMDAKIAADKAGAASSVQVGTAIAQTDQKISQSVGAFERLKRQFIDGYANASRMEGALISVSRGFERGALTANEAAQAVEGVIRRYGVMGNSAELAARGQVELAAAVERANAVLLQQASIKPAAFDTNSLRAQQNGANFSSDLDSRLGVNGGVSSARTSASVFEEAAREAERYAQEASALRAQLDPVAASQARINAEIAEYSTLLSRAQISTTEFAQAESMARARHDQFVASLNRTPVNDNRQGGAGAFQTANIAAQFQDIGVTAAMGMNPLQIALQQGTQLSAVLGPMGAAGAVKGLATAFGSLFSITSLGTIALVAAAAASIQYFMSSKTEAKSSADVLKEHQEAIKRIRDLWGEAADQRTKYGRESSASASFGLDTSITALMDKLKESTKPGIISAAPVGAAITDSIDKYLGDTGMSAREFRGTTLFKKLQIDFGALYKDTSTGKDTIIGFVREIEEIGRRSDNAGIKSIVAAAVEGLQPFKDLAEALKEARLERDRLFDTVGPNGMLLSQGTASRTDRSASDAFMQQQQVSLQRAKAAFEAQVKSTTAISPQQKAEAARAGAAAQYNDGESGPIRAQRIELAGKQALVAAEHELSQARIDRERSSQASLAAAQNELSLIGKTVQEQARLRAEYEATAQIRDAAARAGVAADEKEIAGAKAKAAQIAQINQQVAAGKMLQDQGYQIEQLQLEASLIGASAQERARATSALQAEQQLRQQGIDLLSREGQQYQANAVAMAESRVEIERQNAAYTSLQQTEGSMIDAMLSGTGSLKDKLKAVAGEALKFVATMGANSVKNSLTGTNLPTLGDLFTGKPAIPGGMTSTGVMTVSAGVVNVAGAGGVTGSAGGLAGLLGYKPAGAGGLTAPVIPVERAPLPSIFDKQVGYTPPYEAGTTKGGIPLSTITTTGGLTADVNSNYAGNFQGFTNELSASGYKINSIGGYNYRNINGTNKLSNHAFGDAIDINPGENPVTYGSTVTNMPSNVSEMAGKYGLEWGGDWNNKKDPMHFEVAKGAQPMQLDKMNQSVNKLSSATASAATDVGKLGDTSLDAGKSLMDSFGGANSALTKIPTPSAAGMFPAAPAQATPTGGGGFLSLISSLFGLFKFGDGTDFAPGGVSMVGERGPELVNLPRGSQVKPTHKLNHGGGSSGGGRTKVDVGVSIDQNGNLHAFVKNIAHEAAEESGVRLITSYDRDALPSRMKQISDDPYAQG